MSDLCVLLQIVYCGWAFIESKSVLQRVKSLMKSLQIDLDLSLNVNNGKQAVKKTEEKAEKSSTCETRTEMTDTPTPFGWTSSRMINVRPAI